MDNLQKEYERIEKYATPWGDMGNYVLNSVEAIAISDCSNNIISAISLAFRFGFEKGCRKTRKAVKL
ncbi:hypothetical protein FMM68_09915 [Lachnospiraceae bacterium MD329]|nr:hypothetical protein [Lachnospiraceae bacterium MD329]